MAEPSSGAMNMCRTSSVLYTRIQWNDCVMSIHFPVILSFIHNYTKYHKFHDWRLKSSPPACCVYLPITHRASTQKIQSLATTLRTSNLWNARIVTLCWHFLTYFCSFASIYIVVTIMNKHIIESTSINIFWKPHLPNALVFKKCIFC